MEDSCDQVSEDPFSRCDKRHDHQTFVKVKDFTPSHLPKDCRDDLTFKSIMNAADLTVRILVTLTSKNRPVLCPITGDPYPSNASEASRAACTRAGSGFVSRVHIRDDSNSLTSVTRDQCMVQAEGTFKAWAEIVVCTARHVVFDATEAKNSVVELFYDEESKRERMRRLKVQDSVYGFLDVGWDVSWITCITQDLELATYLQRLLHDSRQLHAQMIQRHFQRIRDSPSLFFKGESSDYHGNFTSAGAQITRQVTEVSKNTRESEETQAKSEESLHDVVVTSHSSHDLRRANGCSDDAAVFEPVKRGLELDENETKKIANKMKRFQASESSKDTTDNDFQSTLVHVNGVSQMVMDQSSSALDELSKPASCLDQSNYDNTTPLHRLAVIVSHPHGCSKRITIGRWLERKEEPVKFGSRYNLFTRYTYNTPTCPGSSGGPLWLFHSMYSLRHVHSRSLDGELNHSSIGLDSSSCGLLQRLLRSNLAASAAARDGSCLSSRIRTAGEGLESEVGYTKYRVFQNKEAPQKC